MSVKRYDYVVRSGLGTFAVDMEQTANGEYVTHDDYQTIAERCERLEAEIATLQDRLIRQNNKHRFLSGDLDEMRRALIAKDSRNSALNARVDDVVKTLNEMELMARLAGFAQGIGNIHGDDLTELKSMFIRVADQLEELRQTLTKESP